MKRTILTIAIAAGLIFSVNADGRGRNNANNSQFSEQHHNRPGNQGKGHNNGNNNKNRPSQSSNANSNKHQHNNGSKPGNNHNIGQRPPQNQRPPQQAYQHPQANHHLTPPPPRAPHRPLMPAHNNHWKRPTPPPAFRPAPGWRPINSVLGIAFGSAINFTINALINSGYNVTGYANDAVYVANATMLNMLWPDATLYYGNGGLYGSEFVYSTPSFNMNRYYNTYNQLVASYGAPFRTQNNGGVITSTWWGPGNQFINLTFQSGRAYNGSSRFFTTLSFGN